MDQPIFMHEKGAERSIARMGLPLILTAATSGNFHGAAVGCHAAPSFHFSIMHSLSSQMNESARSERQVEDDPDGQHDEPDDGEGDGVRKHIRNDRPHAGVFFITADEA